MRRDEIVGGDEAVDLICASTEHAFTMMHKAKDANDVLSNLGSAISYLRQFFRTEELYDPLERVGVTDYDVAHHMTDMYMARRDVGVGFARILQPSGAGMIAALAAVACRQTMTTPSTMRRRTSASCGRPPTLACASAGRARSTWPLHSGALSACKWKAHAIPGAVGVAHRVDRSPEAERPGPPGTGTRSRIEI